MPLFLGSVVIIAMLVHHAVLNNTPYFAGFMSGGG